VQAELPVLGTTITKKHPECFPYTHLLARSQLSFSSFSLCRTLCTCSNCFFSSSRSLSWRAVQRSFSFFFLFGGYKMSMQLP